MYPRPSPVMVAMPDGQPYIVKTLLSKANHKQEKGEGYLSVGLTLTPRATGRSGLNLCRFATKGCAASCFADFDRMAWPQSKRVTQARTLLLARDPLAFGDILEADIAAESRRARGASLPLVVRLNVVSDVPWERKYPELFSRFPAVRFMDYTKDVTRILDPCHPKNYHLTFSRSESNGADCRRVLAAGNNVTIVFRKPPYPATFWGYRVIDGDKNDLRFRDPSPCVVALKAKGAGARRDRTGFVLDHAPMFGGREGGGASGRA